MGVKKQLIMIEDTCRIKFRKRFDEVVSKYPSEYILNIDTGVYVENEVKTYYAFLCVILGGEYT